jgi:hypothetical protein
MSRRSSGTWKLEKYKATIKGLTQFGDRREGTQRNRDAVAWIEAQLKSYGCSGVERLSYTPQQRGGGAGGGGQRAAGAGAGGRPLERRGAGPQGRRRRGSALADRARRPARRKPGRLPRRKPAGASRQRGAGGGGAVAAGTSDRCRRRCALVRAAQRFTAIVDAGAGVRRTSD